MDYTTKDSEYLIKNPSWHSEDSVWKASQIEKIIRRNNINFLTVGEIGCGAGEVLRQLSCKIHDRDIHYYGFDISRDAFAIATSKEEERLKYFCSDLFESDVEFDLLLAIDVLEHVEDYMKFIRKASKKAKYKIFHIPLEISVYSILTGYLLQARSDVGHLHYFTKDTALATLQDCGLKILDFSYTPWAFELSANDMTAKGKFYNIIRKILCMKSYDLSARVLGGFSLLVLAS